MRHLLMNVTRHPEDPRDKIRDLKMYDVSLNDDVRQNFGI